MPFMSSRPNPGRRISVVGTLVLALFAGCAGLQEPPPGAMESQLDLAALKTRLQKADSIGVFTKVALRNQVDDLLQRFRAHHRNGQRPGVTTLRQPYNMLILKLLALVQDRDPPLARAISGSREAIWEILVDPKRFNALT